MQAVVVLQDRLTEIPSSVIGCCLSNAQSLLKSLMKPETFDRVLIGFDMAKLIRRIS